VSPELNTAPNPGKLTLDSSGAVPFGATNGDPFVHQQVILNTPVAPESASELKLKMGITFSVTGVFDLVQPSVLREGYDVMFNNGTPTNTPNDIAMMRVFRISPNDVEIQLAHLDFVLGTTTIIDQAALDPNHDQIALTLTKELAGSNAITGSFYYIDGGSGGGSYYVGYDGYI
jgi:hypothetical protein